MHTCAGFKRTDLSSRNGVLAVLFFIEQNNIWALNFCLSSQQTNFTELTASATLFNIHRIYKL